MKKIQAGDLLVDLKTGTILEAGSLVIVTGPTDPELADEQIIEIAETFGEEIYIEGDE